MIIINSSELYEGKENWFRVCYITECTGYMWVHLSDILCMEPFQHTAAERLAERSDILLALVGSEYLDQDLDDSKAKEIIILLN